MTKFNTTEQQIQTLRQQADDAIASDVRSLNGALEKVVSLNKDIQRQTLLGGDTYALMDERQRVTSGIAKIIPITEIPRENGRIMLLAASGQVLADLDHAEFGFSPTPGIGATDTHAAGTLSAVTLDGRPLDARKASLQSGRLGANLDLRDQIAPDAQNRLDALARDLLDRFSGPSTDASLATGELGLFTLDPPATLPPDSVGLAGQMRLTSRINPSTDDGLWRLRTGLNATAPGPTLDTTNLANMLNAVEKPTTLQPGTPKRDLTGHAAAQVSALATARLASDTDLAHAQARHSALSEDLANRGVDTDTQMQNLLALERAYAANARVLSAVDTMMRTLLEV